jgi:hypothetical protein
MPFLDMPPFFLFEKDEVCWSGGTNIPLISRDIKLCAQKVEPCVSREYRSRFEIVGLELCRRVL